MMLSSAEALPPHYSIIDLGTQAATSINNRKQITGELSGIAYIYFNGTFKNLGTLGGTSCTVSVDFKAISIQLDDHLL
jgi:hypothetical protein